MRNHRIIPGVGQDRVAEKYLGSSKWDNGMHPSPVSFAERKWIDRVDADGGFSLHILNGKGELSTFSVKESTAPASALSLRK